MQHRTGEPVDVDLYLRRLRVVPGGLQHKLFRESADPVRRARQQPLAHNSRADNPAALGVGRHQQVVVGRHAGQLQRLRQRVLVPQLLEAHHVGLQQRQLVCGPAQLEVVFRRAPAGGVGVDRQTRLVEVEQVERGNPERGQIHHSLPKALHFFRAGWHTGGTPEQHPPSI